MLKSINFKSAFCIVCMMGIGVVFFLGNYYDDFNVSF